MRSLVGAGPGAAALAGHQKTAFYGRHHPATPKRFGPPRGLLRSMVKRVDVRLGDHVAACPEDLMTHPEREPRGVRGRPQRVATSGRYRGRRQARRADIGIEQLEPRLAMAVLPVLTDPAQLTAVGSTLYFSAGDATGGQELWKTDGTESGTARVKDIVPGVGGSKPTHLVAAATSLAFQFDGRTDGRGLWITDGTDAGTKSISDPWVKPTG